MTQGLTNTVIDEGKEFLKRHQDLEEEQIVFGSLVWGILRAIAECPICGHFRRPLDENWNQLYCSRCEETWTHEDAFKEQYPGLVLLLGGSGK